MTVTVIEYEGFDSGRPYAVGIPEAPPLQVTQFSSAATSTGFFLPNTRFVQIFSASVNAWALFTASTSSTITLSTATSTNAIPIAANTFLDMYVPFNPAAVTHGGSTPTSTSGYRYSILSS